MLAVPTIKTIDTAMEKIETPNPRQGTKILKELTKALSTGDVRRVGLTLTELAKRLGFFNPTHIEPDLHSLVMHGIVKEKKMPSGDEMVTLYYPVPDWPEVVAKMAVGEVRPETKRGAAPAPAPVAKPVKKPAAPVAKPVAQPVTKPVVKPAEPVKVPVTKVPAAVAADIVSRIASTVDSIDTKVSTILEDMPRSESSQKKVAARLDELLKKVKDLESSNKKLMAENNHLSSENSSLKTRFDKLKTVLAA
jgi:hypothetical protein